MYLVPSVREPDRLGNTVSNKTVKIAGRSNSKIVMAVTLSYFTEFGKLALQKTICGGIYARVYCIFSACTIS